MIKLIITISVSLLLTNTAFAGGNCNNATSGDKNSASDLQTISYLLKGQKPAETNTTTK